MDSEIRIKLARYAHEAWSGWMSYLFSKGEFLPDGRWVMPAWAVERWKRQVMTSFDDLPVDEQNNDFIEADRMLEIVNAHAPDPRVQRLVEAVKIVLSWNDDEVIGVIELRDTFAELEALVE